MARDESRYKILCRLFARDAEHRKQRENFTCNQPLLDGGASHPEGMLPQTYEAPAPRRKRPPSLTKRQRARIIAKTRGCCAYCGFDEAFRGEPIEIDHFVPRSRGGSNAQWNLVAACKSCNREKADMLVEEYRAYLTALESTGSWLFDYENSLNEDGVALGVSIGLITQEEWERVFRFYRTQEERRDARIRERAT